MVTIGDVVAVVAILAGLGVTGWATVVGLAFALPGATARSRARIESDAGGVGIVGVLWLLVPIFGLILMNVPNPLVKLVGTVVSSASLLIAAIGAAGLASLVGDRISSASGLSTYAGVVKGAGFLAAAVQLPIVGWFVALPVVLLIGLGAGFPAVLAGRRSRVPEILPEEIR